MSSAAKLLSLTKGIIIKAFSNWPIVAKWMRFAMCKTKMGIIFKSRAKSSKTGCVRPSVGPSRVFWSEMSRKASSWLMFVRAGKILLSVNVKCRYLEPAKTGAVMNGSTLPTLFLQAEAPSWKISERTTEQQSTHLFMTSNLSGSVGLQCHEKWNDISPLTRTMTDSDLTRRKLQIYC